jgi:predicted alpha/beta-hydrolase family hydrolase
MTSQAQASAPLAGVRGLAFLGFPLHPAGKPCSDRAKHLAEAHVPMLFIQGTRDNLAELALMDLAGKAIKEGAEQILTKPVQISELFVGLERGI